MKKATLTAAALLAAGLTTGIGTAQAQLMNAADDRRTIQGGIGAGITLPLGDFGKGYDTGYHLTLQGTFRPGYVSYIPFAVQGDLMYHNFGGSSFNILNTTYKGSDINLVALIAAGKFTLPVSAVSLEALVGGGLYYFSYSDAEVPNFVTGGTQKISIDSKLTGGFNGGVKAQLNFITAAKIFVEARYHYVLIGDGISMLPITVGVAF